jgi:cytochrome c2
MFKTAKTTAALCILASSALSGSHSAGDAAEGEKVFKKCKACHVVEEGKNKTGPSLYGVVGRAAGSIEGYKYSKAMAGSGLVWDAETLDAYLTNPKKYVNGTKMAFAGLKKEKDRANVIAYLATTGN